MRYPFCVTGYCQLFRCAPKDDGCSVETYLAQGLRYPTNPQNKVQSSIIVTCRWELSTICFTHAIGCIATYSHIKRRRSCACQQNPVSLVNVVGWNGMVPQTHCRHHLCNPAYFHQQCSHCESVTRVQNNQRLIRLPGLAPKPPT